MSALLLRIPSYGRLRPLTLLLLIAALLWFGRGCSSSELGSVGDSCVEDAECATGFCVLNRCRVGGAESSESSPTTGLPSEVPTTVSSSTTGDEPSSTTEGDDYLEPCENDADCDSGLCISSPLGRVCTKLCLEDSECDDAAGWRCRRIQGDRDLTRICYPESSDLCTPCTADTDCGQVRDRCVSLLDGDYCGVDCQTGGQCPEGFYCASLGEDVAQCVPLEDRCGDCPGVDLQSDVDHCGRCDNRCSFPNGIADCQVGSCTLIACQEGFGNCDGVEATGCPTRLASSATHCGECDRACTGGRICEEGQCVCPEGQRICGDTCQDANVCGGCDDLGSAREGDSCGPCGEDELECRDGTLRCTNTTTNQPGDACGTCQAGTWNCDGEGIFTCDNEPNLLTSRFHCGECTNACGPDQTCDEGVCICSTAGQTACGTECVNIQNSRRHCGECDRECAGAQLCVEGNCQCPEASQRLCAGACVNTQTSSTHCGDCDNPCPSPRQCVGGECRCPTEGTQVCGSSCVNTQTSSTHCGDCDSPCPSPRQCIEGTCRCPAAGTELCGSSCVNTQTSSNHCGECDSPCAAPRQCIDGTCRCPGEGQLFCSGSCVDARTSSSHCGQCGNTCAAPRQCIDGTCRCPGAGEILCNGNCVTLGTTQNCSACGDSCQGGRSCIDGVCQCAPGEVNCGGTCRQLGTTNHCSACDDACEGGRECIAGQCACPGGTVSCGGVCTTLGTRQNCSSCGDSCSGDEQCIDGTCRCPNAGDVLCSGVCTTLGTTQNCGACNDACSGPQQCVGGQCRCPGAGEVLCNGNCVTLGTNGNCSACGDTCNTGIGQQCIDGECRCPSGQGLCNGVCTSLNSSQNCGSCGNVCSGDLSCRSGSCGCSLFQCRQGTTCYSVGSIGQSCGTCNNGQLTCIPVFGFITCEGATTNVCTGGCENADRCGSCLCDGFCATWGCVDGVEQCVPNTCPSGRTCNQSTGVCVSNN